MKKIERFSVKALRVEEDFGFLQSVERKVNECFLVGEDEDELSVKKGETPALLKSTLSMYQKSVEAFDEALKESNTVPSTAVATLADEERDAAWRHCNAFVKAMTVHPDNDVRGFASDVKSLFDKYGNPTALSQMEESGVLHNLLQDLEALDAEKRKTLGLDAWLNDLKKKAEVFIVASDERTKEEASRVVGVVKAARKTADESYDKLVTAVNALALLEGEENYTEFIDWVNRQIENQRIVLKTRATLNAKKAAEADKQEKPEKLEDSLK